MTFSINILPFAPLICVSLAGCSYNGFGTSSSAAIVTGNAVVHELRGRGLHVATMQGTAIFSFGIYHEVLVFAGNCEDEPTGLTGRQALIKTQTLAASVTDTTGLEIALGRRWSGLTLGRHQAAVLVEVPQGTEIARSLHLDLNDLSATNVDQLDGILCNKETGT